MHQLDVMFEESPPWDTEHKYLPNNLQVSVCMMMKNVKEINQTLIV